MMPKLDIHALDEVIRKELSYWLKDRSNNSEHKLSVHPDDLLILRVRFTNLIKNIIERPWPQPLKQPSPTPQKRYAASPATRVVNAQAVMEGDTSQSHSTRTARQRSTSANVGGSVDQITASFKNVSTQ